FEIDSLSSAGRTNFHEFVIKAGCTSIEKFDPGPGSAFVPSTQLDTVFTSKTITPDVGWNTLAFDHRFNWDGHSDLIIEVTFYNPTYATDNPVMKFSTVNYLATNYTYMRGSQFIASREVVGSSQYPTAMLPNTRFSLCANSNIANYDYLWYSTHGNGTFLSPNNNDTMRVALDRQHDSLFKLVLIDRQAPQCRDTLSKQFFVFDGPFPVHPDTATFCDPDNNLPLRNWVFGRNLVLPFGVWRGTGIVDSILGIWDPKVSGLGKFMVSYGSPLSVCAHRDSITLHIRPSAQVFPKIVCKGDRHPLHSAQPFKWVQGAYIDSMWQAPQMQYFLHPNQTLPKKVMRSYYENSFGCYHPQQDSVEIIDSLYFLGEYYEGRIQHFTEMCYNQSEQLYSSIPAHWHHTALPGLITDSGWIDMSKLNLNMGDTQFVEIGMTNAACLDTAKFNILALRPPEMEIITKEYCKREFKCGGLVSSEQHDTLRLWIRKQAPLQHLKDTIFHLPSHNGLWWRIDISGHSINGWLPSPNPLSIQSPQLGRFRWCDKREDSIEVSFHFNLLLDNPKSCRHADTGILYFRNTDTLQSPTITKSICGKDTVMLYAPTYGGWTRYKWSDGSTGKSLITDYSGTISVYTELVKGCYQEQKFDVTRCLGEVENPATTSIQIYPVPTPGILH
ncbi:MAG: hypothetical protein KDC37_06935, partial [Flavobacteriales bacterium]|nr:hypothetical protein [Flavobacteriales bacterium]